jgi:undecaprenyl-diphosphatase
VDFINAVILGVVEGITEFLPISSTGHLIVVNQFVHFNSASESYLKMFDIVIQLGAILSVVIYFWKKIYPFGSRQSKEEKSRIWNNWFKALAAVIPAVVIGAVAGEKIKSHLMNSFVVSIAFLAGGIILIWIESRKKNANVVSLQELTYKTAVIIGLIQCMAFIPGISRSAATIIGAMLLGLTRESAVEFSFFLAIPTMVLATGYSLVKTGFHLTGNEWALLAVGFAVSFAVALSVIAGLMGYIRKHDFKPFGVYRILTGAALIVLWSAGIVK